MEARHLNHWAGRSVFIIHTPDSPFHITHTQALGGGASMAMGGYTQVGGSMLSQSSLSQRAGAAAFDFAEEGEDAAPRQQQAPLRRRGGGGLGGSTQLSQLSQLQTGGGLLLLQLEGGEEEAGAGRGRRVERTISQDLAGLDDDGGAEEGGGDGEGAVAAGGGDAGFFGEAWAGLRRLHGLNRELCMPAFMAALVFLAEKVRVVWGFGGLGS